MIFPKKSLVDCRHLTSEAVTDLFDLARKSESFDIRDASRKIVALVFWEPSTRTRSSFQVAAHRVGAECFVIEAAASSLAKGETLLDTLLNLNAMDVDLFVVRHGNEYESLSAIAPRLNVPLINAGEGIAGHPTQALLDLFTICEERKVRSPADLQEHVLFVGDVVHSRVARSNFELLRSLKIPFAFATPPEWTKNELSDLAKEWDVQNFKTLQEGLKWATVVMGLRVQNERHEVHSAVRDNFIANYQLNSESLRAFSKKGLILHPGPVNWGVEMTTEVQNDERYCLLKQVSNGITVRAALIARLMELI